MRTARSVPTFTEAAETVIGIHEPGWKDGGKTEAQWRSSLRDYVMKRLGKRRVSEIDTVDIMAVLLPIWMTKASTARKVRQRIGAVMRWSVVQGYRSDNPAGDVIGTALPKANGIRKQYAAKRSACQCWRPRGVGRRRGWVAFCIDPGRQRLKLEVLLGCGWIQPRYGSEA